MYHCLVPMKHESQNLATEQVALRTVSESLRCSIAAVASEVQVR